MALGISLGLGLLVGMQRERVSSHIAGIRTFPLITLLGTVAGLMAGPLGGWTVGAGLLALAVATAVSNVFKIRRGEYKPGITTEIAIFLMYFVGAFLVIGPTEIAVAVGAVVAILLHAKQTLRRFAKALGDKDVRAIMQFVLISLVILPVLPDRTFGPLEVFNPRITWLMVVLVTGISLGGYLSYKFFRRQAGLVLSGLIGGMISSTATTVSYARRAATAPDLAPVAAMIVVLATAVMYVRVLIEISLVGPSLMPVAAWPVCIMLAVTLALGLAMWLRTRGVQIEMPEQENPSELRFALVFGVMYTVVLFAVAASKQFFDDRGIYAVAAISGLTDMDAITLSTARLVEENRLSADIAWRAIILASLSNMIFKTCIVGMLGNRRLLGMVAGLFAIAFAVGILLLIFWRPVIVPVEDLTKFMHN
ncbi:MAG: MgtC/SapB family protein [Phycisphaeraceae bacterium]|nr:MAG: MgtC/SapB family protein [Phycisphaeraceae bacterium]